MWVLAVLFAFAPSMSLALSVPMTAFSKTLVHAHADDDSAHAAHSHSGDEHGHVDFSGEQNHDRDEDGNSPWHVHQDASVPSIMLPSAASAEPSRATGHSLWLSVQRTLTGSCPPNLLRPPIRLSYV
jgi:hypothetical protein